MPTPQAAIRWIFTSREPPRRRRAPPADRPGVVAVHLATEDPLPPGAALGRRDHTDGRREPSRAQRREVDERDRAEREGTEDALLAEAVERPARHELDQLAEEHEAEVAVDAARARVVFGALAVDLLVDVLLRAPAADEVRPSLLLDALDLPVIRAPGRKSGAVAEQVAEARVRLPVHAEIVEEARHPVVELHLPLVHER